MSFENRDWYREDARPRWSLSGMAPKWWLLGGLFLAFLAQKAVENAGFGRSPFLEDHLALSVERLRAGEAWQALTYVLLHGDAVHLLWNLAALFLFATVVEDLLPARRVALLFLAGALGGAAGHLLWVAAGLGGAGQRVIGASGAVTAVLAYAMIRAPRRPLQLFFVLPVPLALLGALFLGVDLVRAATGTQGEVAVQAHLGGAAAGALLWWRPWSRRRALPGRGPRGRVEAFRDPGIPPAPREPARPEGEEDARVDALLERIHVSGITSLTEEERAFLNRVSTRYRGRRR